jgi:predicted nucleotidyltransferase
MISGTEKKIILGLARKYKVRELFLFGSSCSPKKHGRDIDLGVRGVPAANFFNFYGDLMLSLSRAVDLVDLTKKNKFNALVCKDGLRLYGKAS